MPERYARVLQALREQPWAMVPSAYEALLALVQARLESGRLSAEEIEARVGDRERPAAVAKVGQVAVLALHGVIAHRMNLFTAISGGTSTELVGQALDQALADPEVHAIVLSIDSPGGPVAGVEELAQKIHAARGTKPIVAVADALAASAAYWIGAQADQLVASPSAQVGSIGIVTTHTDVSKADAEVGIKRTVIAIPPAKAEAHPYEPLSEEARAGVVSAMQPFYELFVKAVARGRGIAVTDVTDGYGQGRVLAAVPAKEAGMVDRIESLAHVIARLSTPQGRRAVLDAHASSAGETTAQEPAPATAQESRPDLWRSQIDLYSL